ncbi:MAG: hypothetical protein EZS28_022009 [Streblomastix strix]|uniref:Uncharacterized protein n=1 Tax=Streblomastix strix TaxID=222440 RepID=A0A5J4VJL8_9EUKA|nr:MAG: hypothetical protein EZS28_022009 [Streblomastix strix]
MVHIKKICTNPEVRGVGYGLEDVKQLRLLISYQHSKEPFLSQVYRIIPPNADVIFTCVVFEYDDAK